MLNRHDLVTPTLGGHTWFEKPALLYWMMIGAYRVFGVSEYTARLAPALCGLLTIVAVSVTARRIERSGGPRGFGFLTGVVTASELGMIVFSRGASFDIVITMTTTGALCLFLLWELPEGVHRKNLLLAGFYVLVGLSLISKGLIGIVIPLGVICGYYALRRSWPNRSFIWSLFWGIPLACLVSSIWYGPVIAQHGRVFIDEFFIQHHFARYLSNKYHHPQPVYFYIAILALLTLPWTAYLAEAFVSVRLWSWRGVDSIDKTRVFATAWLLMPLLFFSFSGSKLPGYLLPVLPATGMLAGDRLVQGNSKWALWATGLLCLVLGAVCLAFSYRSGFVATQCALGVALPFFCAGLYGLTRKQNDISVVVAIAAAVFLALIIALNCGALQVARRESVRDLLLLADQQGYAGVPVFAREGSERTAEFYAAGRVVYDDVGEPVVIENAQEMLAEVSRRNVRILVFVPLDQVEVLSRLPSVDLIGENGTVALIGIRTN